MMKGMKDDLEYYAQIVQELNSALESKNLKKVKNILQKDEKLQEDKFLEFNENLELLNHEVEEGKESVLKSSAETSNVYNTPFHNRSKIEHQPISLNDPYSSYGNSYRSNKNSFRKSLLS